MYWFCAGGYLVVILLNWVPDNYMISEDFSLLVAFLLVIFSLFFRGFLVVFSVAPACATLVKASPPLD